MSVIIDDLGRKTLQIEEDNSVGNSVSVGPYEDRLGLAIDNPWAGDSETGFGCRSHITLSLDDAESLGRFLIDVVRQLKAPGESA